jgi:hypothetical protein
MEKDDRTEEEKAIGRAIWQGSAILANKVFVVWTGQMFRITFAEQPLEPNAVPIFRAAIGLAPGDALGFADALAEAVKPIRDAISAQQAMDKQHG